MTEYDFFKKFKIFIRTNWIIIASGFSLITFLYLWIYFGDVGYLSAGITAVLVLITGWYSHNVYQQLKISEKGKQKEYIAEIARSIFSAMQQDILIVKRNLENKDLIKKLNPTETRVDGFVLSRYFEGNISIRGKIVINSPQYDFFNPYGAERPAKAILDIPDEEFKVKYLPKIKELCIEFEKQKERMNEQLEKIINEMKPIWANFKTYCNDLDKNDLKEIFNQKNPDSNRETYYCIFLKYAISLANPEPLLFSEYFDGGVRTMVRNNDFKTYIIDNKDKLREWLFQNNLGVYLSELQKIETDLLNNVIQLDQQINNLFLYWKLEYFLTEEEMNLNDTTKWV